MSPAAMSPNAVSPAAINPLLRWLKFNLVGAMGMGVQLTALALLNRSMRGHYLCASAAAIELTLLHNFVWHTRYTWRDRCNASENRRNASDNLRHRARRLGQLARFHLSNGVVSMLGNLILMRLLVHGARLPLLVSNALAVLCCSIANYCLSSRWAFAAPAHPARRAVFAGLPQAPVESP